MSTKLFLGTGSNLGDRQRNLQQASELIAASIGDITKASHIYLTQAWGIETQPDFLNQALEIRTDLLPAEVLERALQIERDMGRERHVKWGERLIDIDILLYEDRIIRTEKLTVPHPFLQDRNFVLVPLAEIAPDFIHPILEKSVFDLLLVSNDNLVVKIWSE